MSGKCVAAGVVIVCGFLAGCSSTNTPATPGKPDGNAVGFEVAGLIRSYSGENNKGPTKAADLKKYELGFPLGYAAVQGGQVVVIWGSTVAGEGGGGSKEVVAYEKDAPTAGGFVVLQDGSVKQMTADEFKAAPKAAGK